VSGERPQPPQGFFQGLGLQVTVEMEVTPGGAADLPPDDGAPASDESGESGEAQP
jgi:hypothetical protein